MIIEEKLCFYTILWTIPGLWDFNHLIALLSISGLLCTLHSGLYLNLDTACWPGGCPIFLSVFHWTVSSKEAQSASE